MGVTCSPDGQRLAMAYFAQEPGEIILKTMPVGGGEPRDLHKFTGATATGPITWTSDGKFIYSVVRTKDHPESTGRRSRLWSVSAESGEAENLGLEMSRIYQMSVHPDGQRIAFSSLGPTIELPELWVMENFLPSNKPEKR